MVSKEQPTDLLGQTCAQLIMARRIDLHQRPNTFAQTCLLALDFPLQSGGGPYILVQVIYP